MIIDIVNENIFDTFIGDITFGINAEGYNDAGFAGQVAGRYWPALANIGEHDLGTVLRHSVGDKTFYAIVCHSLSEDPGWSGSPRFVEEGLNKIEVKGRFIAIVLIGAGPVGQMQGANPLGILGGIARSQHKCIVYHL